MFFFGGEGGGVPAIRVLGGKKGMKEEEIEQAFPQPLTVMDGKFICFFFLMTVLRSRKPEALNPNP